MPDTQFALCLVIDDDDDIRLSARLALAPLFAEVKTTASPAEAVAMLRARRFDMILLDANFARGATDGAEGFRWLATILATDPAAAVVMITAHSSVRVAVDAMKQGATDFVSKPWNNDRLLATVRNAAQLGASRRHDGATVDAGAAGSAKASFLLGASPAMARVQSLIEKAAPTDANVLILGENGTGKELVARELHRLSRRADAEMVTVDLGAVSETLFDSELFGHVKGAFTDARVDRIGRIQTADGGTLFLDEIGNLPLHLQPKLLTVLEQRRVVPVGANLPVAVDVRVVSASNADLHDERQFRQDLLFRLNTVEIMLPPLRERREDVPLLLARFLAESARRYGKPERDLPDDVLAALVARDWPGNVRALRHAAERAVILADSIAFTLADFPLGNQGPDATPMSAPTRAPVPPSRTTSTSTVSSVRRSRPPCASTRSTSPSPPPSSACRVEPCIGEWKNMVFSHGFAVQLAGRVLLLLGTTAAAAALLVFVRAPTAALLALVSAALAGLSTWRLVNQGNIDLARFITALERSDFGQSYRWQGRGAGFEQLGVAYERALDRLRSDRTIGVGAARAAEALVDGAPTPLLILDSAGEVRFANMAARRLLGRSEPCPVETLSRFGPPFVAALRAATPGSSQLSHLFLDGLSQRVTLDTTSIEIGGRAQRVVALKIIQMELDGAELAAQIDLVRVLTHEVMNSLTPVTSLAATASRLVARLDPTSAPEIADAQLAIEALARRAVDLERFVISYKGFSDAPVLCRSAVQVAAWFEQLDELFATTPAAAGVDVAWSVADGTPDLNGDPALLTQVMLNLLKNAGEAAATASQPSIEIKAATALDGRVKVAVIDNGPGIPSVLARDVFLPFFTTKAAGTGIGLSFARQIVMLHGGYIGIVADGRGHLELLLPAYP